MALTKIPGSLIDSGDNLTITDLTVTGNLSVTGTSTSLETATLQVEDKNIVLNYGSGDTSASADGAGITIQNAIDATSDATFNWGASNDRFKLSHGLEVLTGNLGIGTSSPTHEIDLIKTLTAINDNPTLQVKNAWNTEGNNVGFDNKAIALFSAGNDTVITKIQSRYDSGANFGQIGTQTNHDLLLTTNNTERMRIATSGELSLGVTANNVGGAGDINMKGNQAIRWMHATDGTQYGDMYVDTGNNVVFRNGSSSTERMRIDSSGIVDITGGTLKLGSGANRRLFYRSANSDVLLEAASGLFYRQDIGNTNHSWFTGNSERLRLDSNGQLLIKGSVSSPTSAAATLHVNQNTAGAGNVNVLIESNAPNLNFVEKNTTNKNWQLYHNAGDFSIKHINDSIADIFTSITFYDNGNIGAPTGSNIYNASDQRLKKNITSLTEGISIINALNPVKFNWMDDFVKTENDKTMYGFVAQEVQGVFSDAVENFINSTIDVNGTPIENPLRVNEKFMVPVLVKAVQELSAKLDAAEARIKTLEG